MVGVTHDEHTNAGLFAVLLIGQPIYFFWFELIPLNLLFVYLIFREETMSESMQEVAHKWRDLA